MWRVASERGSAAKVNKHAVSFVYAIIFFTNIILCFRRGMLKGTTIAIIVRGRYVLCLDEFYRSVTE